MSLRHLAPVLALVVLSGAVPDAEPQQPVGDAGFFAMLA